MSMNKSYIEKVHRVHNHKGVRNMEYAIRNTGRLEPGGMKLIKEVVDEYKICKKNSRSRSRPTVAIPRASEFNSVVTLDLNIFGAV